MQMGMSALFGCLETLYLQNIDLYPMFKNRLVDLLEFHASLFNKKFSDNRLLCSGNNINTSYLMPTFLVGYTAYSTRMGVSLPNTEELLPSIYKLDYKDASNKYRHGVVFEALHHSGWYV
jgi:hypothetical protein